MTVVPYIYLMQWGVWTFLQATCRYLVDLIVSSWYTLLSSTSISHDMVHQSSAEYWYLISEVWLLVGFCNDTRDIVSQDSLSINSLIFFCRSPSGVVGLMNFNFQKYCSSSSSSSSSSSESNSEVRKRYSDTLRPPFAVKELPWEST